MIVERLIRGEGTKIVKSLKEFTAREVFVPECYHS